MYIWVKTKKNTTCKNFKYILQKQYTKSGDKQSFFQNYVENTLQKKTKKHLNN